MRVTADICTYFCILLVYFFLNKRFEHFLILFSRCNYFHSNIINAQRKISTLCEACMDTFTNGIDEDTCTSSFCSVGLFHKQQRLWTT